MPLICAGDSITERRPWDRIGPVFNLGRGSDTTAMLRARYGQVLALAPFPVHLLIGTNNCSPDTEVPAAIADIAWMANASRNAGSQVILCKIPPRGFNVQTFNDALAAMAAQQGFTAPVDYWSTMMVNGNMQFSLFNTDYTHPRLCGFRVMDDNLIPRLDIMGIWRPSSD